MWIVLIGAVAVPNKAEAAEAQEDTITYDEGITFEVISPKAGLPEAPESATTSGQTICEGNNYVSNTFNDSWFMGGPLVGISWVPSISATITRIEIWTGETNGPIALAIWSNIAGQPGVNLGNTSYFPIGLPNTWQGAPLNSPVAVTASIQYWVVFDPTGGEQAPIQNCAVGQPYWGSYSGTITGGAIWYGASSSTPFSFPDHCWKFRMFCADACVPPPANAVAWWPGDDNTTDILYGNDGTLMGGATYDGGKVERAFYLVDTADYVQVPHDPNGKLDFGEGDLTVDAWIKTSNPDPNALTIVDKRGGTVANPIGYTMFLYGGYLGFQLGDGGSMINHVSNNFDHLHDGYWHHVAVAVDRDLTAGGNMYVDGQLDHTFNPMTRPLDISNSGDLLIGQRILSYPNAFNGWIDEVELFDRALSEPEIASIYLAGSAGKCKCESGGQLWTSLSGFADNYSPPPPPDPPPNPSSGLSQRYSAWPTKGYDDPGVNLFLLHTFYVPPSGINKAWVVVGVKPLGHECENDRIGLYFTNELGVPGPTEWSAQIGAPGGILPLEWDPSLTNYPDRVIITLDLSNLPVTGADLVTPLDDAGFLDLMVQDDTDIDFAELWVCYTDSCVRAPVDMVAWWPLDEQDGATVVEDIAVAGYHPGTPSPGGAIGGVGPWTVGGKVGDALYFWHQHDNRFVRVPHHPDLEFDTADFSIDAWVKITQYSGTDIQPIVEKMDYIDTSPEYGYRFYLESGVLSFTLASGLGTATTIQAQYPISQAVWHHVAVTVSRDPVDLSPTVSLYIDGTLAAGLTFLYTPSLANTEDLIIGGSLLGDSLDYLDISIDELEIFDRALTDNEVFSIFQADYLGKCKAYLSGMKFHDHNGDGVKDPGDGGLANWTIFIDTDPFNQVLDSWEPCRTTGVLGTYSFTVPPSQYTICEVNQSPWTQTFPAAGACHTVTVAENQWVSDLDFGNYGCEPCSLNIVQNWSFIDGAVEGQMPSPGQIDNWTLAYGTPDVHIGNGCCDLAFVTMWGNQFVGEAIQQTLTFVKDRCYSIKFCALWPHLPGRPYPVRFEFRASNVPLTGTGVPPGVVIGVSPPVTPEQQWMSMPTIRWKAPDDYSILTVSATNQSSYPHGDSTSAGRIDRICIYEYISGDVTGDTLINVGDVVFLISYLYKAGPEPSPLEAGDVNCDGIVDVGDVVYLINYLYKNGPSPCC